MTDIEKDYEFVRTKQLTDSVLKQLLNLQEMIVSFDLPVKIRHEILFDHSKYKDLEKYTIRIEDNIKLV